MSFHIDGCERTCRTKVLAGAAADTAFGVDSGELARVRIVGIRRYHCYGACRTVAGTIAAFYTVGFHHTVSFDPYGMAYLDSRLIGYRDRFDGSRRADVRTLGTLGTAVAAFVRRERLHQYHQIC